MRRFVVIYKDLLGAGGVPYETRALLGGMVAAGAHVAALCHSANRLGLTSGSKVAAEFAKGDDSEPADQMPYGLGPLLRTLRADASCRPVYLLVGCRRIDYLLYALVIRHAGLQCVVFAHGLLSPELRHRGWGGRQKGTLRRLLERCFHHLIDRPLLRAVTATRALSPTEAATLRRLGARSSFAVPDGIDRDWLSPGPLHLTPAPTPLRLLYFGRAEPYQKGLDLLLCALNEVLDERGIELVLAGPDVEGFRRIVTAACGEVPPWIKIVGMVVGDAKAHSLANAHFFVHVSRFEGMAKSVREAVGHGLPVIASYESNFGDWVEQRGMGLATTATVDGIREAAKRALAMTPDEWARMRDEARLFAREHSWHRVALTVIAETAQ